MPATVEDFVQIRKFVSSMPQQTRILSATQEQFEPEPLMLRLLHVFQAHKVPMPEIAAQFHQGRTALCMAIVYGDKKADISVLSEQTVQAYWHAMQKNEPLAEALFEAGYTPCLLKSAMNSITQHRKKIIYRRGCPTFMAKLNYVIGKASL